MYTAAIIIYVIFAVLFGPFWPLSMFAKAGLLGKIVVIAWTVMFISGINS